MVKKKFKINELSKLSKLQENGQFKKIKYTNKMRFSEEKQKT